MLVPFRRRGIARLLEEIRGIVGPGDAVVTEKSEERLAVGSAQRDGKKCLSVRSFQRSIPGSIRFDFLPVESPLGDGKRGGILRVAIDRERQPIQVGFVIEVRGFEKLCVVTIRRRLWCPAEQLCEKGR